MEGDHDGIEARPVEVCQPQVELLLGTTHHQLTSDDGNLRLVLNPMGDQMCLSLRYLLALTESG